VVIASPGEQGEADIGEPPAALSYRRELGRKALHLLSTVIPLTYAVGVSRAIIAWSLVTAFSVAMVVEAARVRSSHVRTAFQSRFGTLLREHESHGLSGASWLITALLVAVIVFPRDVAIASMCAVSLGDAAAAIVGRALARSASDNRKTLGGSVACFAASAISARAIAGLTLPEAAFAGIVAALVERPRGPLDDNLRIALAVGCGILLWRMGFS
jgi:dolichol kinase